jgi:hypothetical protein
MSCHPNQFDMDKIAAVDALCRKLDDDAFQVLTARRQSGIARFLVPRT